MTDETVQTEVAAPEVAPVVVDASPAAPQTFAEKVRDALESLAHAPAAFVAWIEGEVKDHL